MLTPREKIDLKSNTCERIAEFIFSICLEKYLEQHVEIVF